MKNLKTFFAVGITTLLVSCGTTKDTNSVTKNENRGRNNIETVEKSESTSIGSSKISRKESEAVATEKRLAKVEETMYFKKMYVDLDMTEVQVSRFEKDWKSTKNNYSRNNRNKMMNTYERIEYQDKILRDVLNEEQFETYQQWVRENADRK